jgi:hypothetical protein
MPRKNTSCSRFACHVAGIVLLLPVAASANEPSVDARALGIAESMLKYCARVDAADAGRWRQQAKQITQGAPEREIARLRASGEYRAAYVSVTDFVGKVATQNAKRACTVPLAQSK